MSPHPYPERERTVERFTERSLRERKSMAYLAYVDGSRFAMSDDDADRFERAVVAALRSGGDFVDVPTVAGPAARFLITAASKVRLEHLPPGADSEPGDDGGEEFFDFAYFDYEP